MGCKRGKIIKSKSLAIGVIILFLCLAVIPSVNAIDTGAIEVFDRVFIKTVLIFPEKSGEYITAYTPHRYFYSMITGEQPPIIPPPWWTFKIRFKEAIGSPLFLYIGKFQIIGYVLGIVGDFEIIPK